MSTIKDTYKTIDEREAPAVGDRFHGDIVNAINDVTADLKRTHFSTFLVDHKCYDIITDSCTWHVSIHTEEGLPYVDMSRFDPQPKEVAASLTTEEVSRLAAHIRYGIIDDDIRDCKDIKDKYGLSWNDLKAVIKEI